MVNSNGSTGLLNRRNENVVSKLEVMDSKQTKSNGHAALPASPEPAPVKYRHIAAVHSKPRASCLSHDSETSPSLLGFRNLMVIVLGALSFACNTSTARLFNS